MNIFSGLEKIVDQNYPLAKHTWFGLGGNADYFIIPDTLEQLQMVVNRCKENGIPIYVLGYGSNLLIGDEGVRGAVIKLAGDDFSKTSFSENGLVAGAGADLGKLVLDSVRKGLSGIEFTVEQNGPPLTGLVTVFREILEETRLILFVDAYFEQLNEVLKQLPTDGLYVLIPGRSIGTEQEFNGFIYSNWRNT